MSPLKKAEKVAQAGQYMRQYFPGVSDELIQRITDLALRNFKGNYSPHPKEQESPRYASGSGQTYEEFIIDLGRRLTRQEPKDVEEQRLHKIILKGLM